MILSLKAGFSAPGAQGHCPPPDEIESGVLARKYRHHSWWNSVTCFIGIDAVQPRIQCNFIVPLFVTGGSGPDAVHSYACHGDGHSSLAHDPTLDPSCASTDASCNELSRNGLIACRG